MKCEAFSRRKFMAVSGAAGAAILTATLPAAAEEKKTMRKTFTILHTNDMHSAFIGMGPASDYTPFTLNDDTTRGGYARLAGLIAKRKEARTEQGPMLVLDAGDYSMGTAFGAASRETGSELQLMSRMGYDATTFGNHDYDLGPEGLGKSIGVASKAGWVPAVLASNSIFAANDATLAELKSLAGDKAILRHSHTELQEAIIVNSRTPVVQTGLEGRNLGELVVTLDGDKLTVESYRLYAIDDTIAGNRAIADEIEKFEKTVSAAVFASRGYSIDQPLAVAPLGAGVVDSTAGNALVTGYFTGVELKNLLEFLLMDNPAHPGEYFPRASGMRFRYDKSRPMFDAVTAIELGDLDRGYRAIDISGADGTGTE